MSSFDLLVNVLPLMLEVHVGEARIASVTGIPTEGEHWFKTIVPKNVEFMSYLKLKYRGIIWRKEIPLSYLENQWLPLLKVIKVYVTSEGRYNRVMIYHFVLLNHLIGKNTLNLLYYLHKSLTKMDHKVWAEPLKTTTRILHHGLIKLLVLEELSVKEQTWDNFLFWN